MRCERVREQLALLVYDELPADQASAARDHIAHCPPCAQHLERFRTTQQQLSQWPDITAEEPVGSALAQIDEQHRQPVAVSGGASKLMRRRRFVPPLLGAAAGLALAATVLLMGATIHTTDNGLTISFGNAGNEHPADGAASSDPALTDEQMSLLRSMFAQQTERYTAFALDLVDQRVRELEGAQDQRFLALVNTIRAMREEDMQRFEQALSSVALNSREQTRQTRAALDDVMRTMAMRPPVGSNYDQQMNPKEIVP